MFNEDGYPTSGFRDAVGSKHFNEVVNLLSNKPKKPHWFWQLFMKITLMLLCGATVMYLWNWYVASLGVMSINLFHALGIDMLLTFIFTIDADTGDSKLMNSWEKWITNMIFAAFTLVIGFVFHFFI